MLILKYDATRNGMKFNVVKQKYMNIKINGIESITAMARKGIIQVKKCIYLRNMLTENSKYEIKI